MDSKSQTVSSRTPCRIFVFFSTLCLVLVALAGAFRYRRPTYEGDSYSLAKEYSWVDHDHPVELPISDLRHIQVILEDPPFDVYPLSDDERATAEWSALAPRGGAFVALGPSDTVFAVTVWHQLHCVNKIRMALVSLDFDLHHMHHCLNYLRQTILCSADTTLETFEPNFTGRNTTRVCRDWSQIYAETESHQDWISAD